MKTIITKNLKKVETVIAAFQKAGSEGGTASLMKMEAEEVVKYVEKLKEYETEIESISTSLQDVMCESEPNELKGITPEEAIARVKDDVESYLEKKRQALEENKKTISEALERNSQIITTNVTSVSVEKHTQSKDKFQSVSELKPKYLEKDANLLEVRNWIQQTKNYIDAGYKDSPPKKGVYKYMMPLLHHTWTTSLQNIDPNNRSLEELAKALEDEAKRGDPKHICRVKLLQIRRGSDAHSDFMDKLRETGSIIEYDKMSLDEFLIHLFIRDADSQMAKMALEILERDNLSIHMVVKKIKET